MKFGFAILASLLCAVYAAALPPAQVPAGRDVVSPTAFASFDPVARGGAFQIAVVLKIREGFHINAREKSAEYLIATDLRSEAPAGFKTGDVTYPKGELHTFSTTSPAPRPLPFRVTTMVLTSHPPRPESKSSSPEAHQTR